MIRADIYVSIVLKSGSLNLLEHSGPVQACPGLYMDCFIFTFTFTIEYTMEQKNPIFLLFSCFRFTLSLAKLSAPKTISKVQMVWWKMNNEKEMYY